MSLRCLICAAASYSNVSSPAWDLQLSVVGVACAAGDAAATGSGKAAALDLQGEPTGESFRNGASAGQDDDEEACAAELSMTTGLGCNLKGIDSLLAADICGKSDGIGEDGGRTEAEASMATDEVV